MYLNFAHIALTRWAFVVGDPSPERYLELAVQWGKQAGSTWQEEHGHSARAQKLWEHVTSSSVQAQRRAEQAYQQGQIWENKGKLGLALEFYQQAFTTDSKLIEAGYQIYRLSTQVEQLKLAQRQEEMLSALEPEYHVTTTLADGTKLLGYDLDEIYLERGVDLIPITFYWELSTSLGDVSQWETKDWTYVRVQNRLYQIGQVANLVPNGGFEQDLSTIAVVPHGYRDIAAEHKYQDDRHRFLRSRHQLMIDKRDGGHSQVAVVVNPSVGLNGIMSVQEIMMEPGALYVFGGWMRVGDGGSGDLGGVWRKDSGEAVRYWYVARERSAQPWQWILSTVTAPVDGSLSFRPLALNRGEGEVYFDDLVCFQITPPLIRTTDDYSK